MKTLLAVFHEEDAALLDWAKAISRRLGDDRLGVLCVSEGDSLRLDNVTPKSDKSSELARTLIAQLPDEQDESVLVFDCKAPRPSTGVLEAILDLQAQLLILPLHAERHTGKHEYAIHRLARVAPVDTLLLDIGDLRSEPAHIVVPQVGGGGRLALQLAIRAFGDSLERLVAIADDAAAPRSDRVFHSSLDRLPKDKRELLEQVIPEESLLGELQNRVRADDLVFAEVESTRELHKTLHSILETRAAHEGPEFAIGIVRSGEAVGPGRLERAIGHLRAHLPRLDREERREVHRLLEDGGKLSTNFLVMLTLSTAIASLGLIQNSTAVVVGAMLVAPLMTPIVATGMSLVQSNKQLFRDSTRATWIGIATALATSMLIGLLSPWSDLSQEILSRGAPNLFDLGIAACSGFAGAFAIARPGAASALAGVAIAVALVPPLSSIGIAAVKGMGEVVFGASILFLTNLLAIIAGSALVFRLFGLERQHQRAPRWVRLAISSLLTLLLPVCGVLMLNLQDQVRTGTDRSFQRPLPQETRLLVKERVADSPGVRIVWMAQSELEDGFSAQVVLSTPGDPDAALTGALERILKGRLGAESRCRVLWLREVDSR